MSLRPAPLRRLLTCPACQWHRYMSQTSRRLVDTKQSQTSPDPTKTTTTPEKPKEPDFAGSAINAPRSYGPKTREFTPEPLPRPIGMTKPPHPMHNTGIDTRTIQQRRDDFVNYEKHLARRRELKDQISRPYFRDWTNLKLHGGKSFLAPPRPFRADMSLFFPNFVGSTLAKEQRSFRDTTNVLHGKTSVVSIFSGKWAEDQVKTFTSPEENPALHTLIAQGRGAQLVQLNVEENALRAWIVGLFVGNLRKQIDEADWAKYFLVKQGMTHEIRESIGLLNSKVGYVYVVDHLCRIRWAASGDALPEERESLVKSARFVVNEFDKDHETIRAMAMNKVSKS